jgi:hypothetical protein
MPIEIEKFLLLCETEYNLSKHPGNNDETLWCAVQRLLGAVYLMQMLGVAEEEIAPIYEEYKKKIMRMEK